MSDVLGIGQATSGIAQGTGAVMAANAAGDASKEQARINQQTAREGLAEQSREFNITQPENARQFNVTSKFAQDTQAARQKAYAEAIARGDTQMTEGEKDFKSEATTVNPELAQQSKDIASGNAQQLQQGTAQMQANLAMQGVRGGQAAALLNRGSGEQAIQAQKDVNSLKFTDAAQRAAELRAYMAAKAGRGQSATLPAGAI